MMNHFSERLLCKAKSKAGKCWVTGFYYEQPIMNCLGPTPEPLVYLITCDETKCADWGFPQPLKQVLVERATVCLSTGLYSKEGRLLFDGDIVKSNIEAFHGRIMVKSNHFGIWGFYILWHKDGKLVSEQCLLDYWDSNACELSFIGNVFDNPELISE